MHMRRMVNLALVLLELWQDEMLRLAAVTAAGIVVAMMLVRFGRVGMRGFLARFGDHGAHIYATGRGTRITATIAVVQFAAQKPIGTATTAATAAMAMTVRRTTVLFAT